MPATPEVLSPATGDTVVLVGTTKGAFLIHAESPRNRWIVSGPHFPGHLVYALAYDRRVGRRRVWAATESPHWGTLLRHTDDFGATWSEPTESSLKFPAASGLALKQIWQVHPGPEAEPDRLFCGVEPAMLFESADNGASWSVVDGLMNHPHREQWQPGGGGLCLHTILTDPSDSDRMAVAISTGGFYRSDDGGRSWYPRNQGVRAEFMPNRFPEFGQCVHKVVHHPSRPERLFLQNHWGLYRSDDWGDSWHDIANGVPSDFGFAMAMHPHDVDTVYIVPIESDEFRCVPEGKMRVYRTRDSGASWEPLSRGLPQEGAYETILRDAMCVDDHHPAGVYVGTKSGTVFGSADDGDGWSVIADGLPPIACVRAATITG